MTDAEFMKRHEAGCEVIGRGTGVPDSLCKLADQLQALTDGEYTDRLIASLGGVLLSHRDGQRMETTLRAEIREASPGGLKEAVQATRHVLGTSELRSTVIGWAEAVDAAWREADTNGGKYPLGGQYEDAFDWEFVPGWITANIDWSDHDHPHINPVIIPAPDNGPLADLGAELRGTLENLDFFDGES